MKIKVAVVLPYFGNGGAENMVAHLVSHLDLDQVNVQVFCIYGNAQKNHLEDEVRSHGVEIIYIGKGLGFSPSAVFKLYKALNKFKPDVIHTHLMACMYSAPWILLHRIKMLHTIHSIPKAENNYKIRRIVMTILYKIRKAVPVAISSENQRLIAEYYRLKIDSIEVVDNPVVTKKFYHNGYDNEYIMLVTVGRLSKEKNQGLLIQVLANLVKEYPKIKLRIIGDGKERETLRQKATDLNLQSNIEFTGNVPDVENYLCDADIFVLSSLYEGVPLSILEAMAAGLPIVSTDVGGVKDIVTDNGILVNSGDVDAMTQAILKLIRDRTLRLKYGEHSLANVKKYDIENVSKHYIDLYKKYS